ncbi:Z1 domain-containing protein [Lacticaseibacillus porcinae]|uniref:Z1 domain-containing protein n=1 Tax=Lacticaseibacillus porcinae TaxID=1123687 RepID=UPI000F771B3F|nr:Z1 domain-containing protein [Lacticaseibacillus porcinae]
MLEINEEGIEWLEHNAKSLVEEVAKKSPQGIPDGKIEIIVRQMIPLWKCDHESEISDNDVQRVVSFFETKYKVTMHDGTMFEDKSRADKKWYFNSISERGSVHWDGYQEYLSEDAGLPDRVIKKIEFASNQIMDVLGDPLSGSPFQRKGLVIGSVQSGKTSNYIALMNKAADAGYRVVIVLTGMIEKLRKQTQTRIDEGFVGADSREITVNSKNTNHTNRIGVGLKHPDMSLAFSVTSTTQDFKPNVNVRINGLAKGNVVVFTVKKNTSVLRRLHKWLQDKNTSNGGMIDEPLLLIDDEADNASINTKDPEEKDPTAINQCIRNLLKLFTKYSYVGFTATPFANIFIDPHFDDPETNDLFPKDFIYLLDQPSNYIGPSEVYQPTGKNHYFVRYNDDMEAILPLKHKKETSFSVLPESLKRAIMLFLLANAVRDLRGQKHKHRSMLIHVSRFIDVQKQVQEVVSDYVRRLQTEVKLYGLNSQENGLIAKMHKLFTEEYKNSQITVDHCKFDATVIPEAWEDVKAVLFEAIAPIQVYTVNSSSASQRLNYDDNPQGLRIIAVGGLSLARGLTLEGLTTSYFYRNTKMYDTLMQMGRWFGYRDGYADLCRLWTSRESADWYRHISVATEELRREIRKMSRQNRKPIDFGLRVRSAEDTPLIVTARNKMKATDTIRMTRQLNGQTIETPVISSDFQTVDANMRIVVEWLKEIEQYRAQDVGTLALPKKPTFLAVPKKMIMNVVERLNFPQISELSEDSSVVKEIDASNNPLLQTWDVVVATKKISDDNSRQFGSLTIQPHERSFTVYGSDSNIRLSGNSSRLGTREYGKGGLSEKTAMKIEESIKLNAGLNALGKKNVINENSYFGTGITRRPLLVIYPIKLKKSKNQNEQVDEIAESFDKASLLDIGISLGVPDIEGMQTLKYTYVTNAVFNRALIEGTDDQSAWAEPDDEDENELEESDN